MVRRLLTNPFFLTNAAALLAILAFPKPAFTPAIFVFPIFLILLTDALRRPARAFAFGLLASYLMMLGGGYWVVYVLHEFGYLSWFVSSVLFLGFCGLAALNFPVFLTCAVWLQSKFPIERMSPKKQAVWFALALPALFTVIEFLLPKLFPWYIGHALYSAKLLIQICEWTGASALTFVLFSSGSVAAFFLLQWVHRRPRPSLSIWAIPALLWTLVLGVGAYRLGQPLSEHRPLKVALIQANIGSLEKVAIEKGIAERIRVVMKVYETMTEQALASSPELVIWPETAMPFELGPAMFSRELLRKISQWEVPLITGAFSTSKTQPPQTQNSAFLLVPEREGQVRAERYDKNLLLAFGEYMPLGEEFPKLYATFPQVSSFLPGNTQKVFTLANGTRLGITICYEDVVASYFRKVVQPGVQAVVNLSNDSWFGPRGEPEFHAALTVFRAVEARVPFIRVANTGISMVVDDRGRITTAAGVYQPQTLISTVDLPVTAPQTFYIRFGEWFVALLGLGLAVLPFWFKETSRPFQAPQLQKPLATEEESPPQPSALP